MLLFFDCVTIPVTFVTILKIITMKKTICALLLVTIFSFVPRKFNEPDPNKKYSVTMSFTVNEWTAVINSITNSDYISSKFSSQVSQSISSQVNAQIAADTAAKKNPPAPAKKP